MSGQDTRFDPASFAALVTNLGYQGQILLGVVPHPQTGEKVEPNSEGGKAIIGTLEMLEQKTEGNLSDEEAKYLTRILADLRMRFVQLQTS